MSRLLNISTYIALLFLVISFPIQVQTIMKLSLNTHVSVIQLLSTAEEQINVVVIQIVKLVNIIAILENKGVAIVRLKSKKL